MLTSQNSKCIKQKKEWNTYISKETSTRWRPIRICQSSFYELTIRAEDFDSNKDKLVYHFDVISVGHLLIFQYY